MLESPVEVPLPRKIEKFIFAVLLTLFTIIISFVLVA
jgi:hypothetical protein